MGPRHLEPRMSESTKAQDQFERILRHQADMSDSQRAIAARDPHSQQEGEPLDSGRLRQLADEFRTTFSHCQLAALESWDDDYMTIIAVAIGHGFPLRPGQTGRPSELPHPSRCHPASPRTRTNAA